MSKFTGQSAIVTGAGGGMGLAIAADLASRGAQVVGVDQKEVPDDFPENATYLRGDVSDPDLAPTAAAAALKASANGNVDFLVNAAGVAWFNDPGLPKPPLLDGSIVNIDLDAWKRVLDINLTGPMLFSRAVLPIMLEHRAGSIVHIASIAGLRLADGALDAYQVSKAGLISLSRAIAAQYGPMGVRSNTVCPGAIATPMIAGIYENDPAREDSMALRVPLRRVGTTDDVCAAVTYLLSDASSFVTGTDLVVDGGWLTNMG
ncbi:SDR family NAD(P)-dependent oxidoreductase [Nocardioides sp.]|uniref:SDR family NAD(P)-dependent oxidoreductase n=1 Tax=Nocardioides sp. TaxID=35761 RepID=UPI003D0A93E9